MGDTATVFEGERVMDDETIQHVDDSVVVPLGSVTVFADTGPWAVDTGACLKQEGFEVYLDATGDSAFGRRASLADAAIVNLDLVCRPAGEICSAWQARTEAPVFMVSGSEDETTVLDAYATGADHFATTAMSSRQLVARLRSLIRRRPVRHDDPAAAADLPIVVDETRPLALVQGVKVPLTQGEAQLVRRLLQRPGRVVSRQELLEAIRPSSPRLTDRSVDFYVRRIREKFETVDDCRRIVAVRGVGFRFETDVVAGRDDD